MTAKLKAIFIEGNAGSGKTTLVHYLRSRMPNLLVREEPLDKWTDVGGCNLLQMMYQDCSRWATAFEAYAMLTLCQDSCDVKLRAADTGKTLAVLERSVHSAFHVFVQNLYKQQLVNEMDYGILQHCYETWCADCCFDDSLVVYLRASPAACMRRVRARGRPEEAELTVERVQQLHNLYEDWLIHQTIHTSIGRIIVVDVDRDLQALLKYYDEELIPELVGNN